MAKYKAEGSIEIVDFVKKTLNKLKWFNGSEIVVECSGDSGSLGEYHTYEFTRYTDRSSEMCDFHLRCVALEEKPGAHDWKFEISPKADMNCELMGTKNLKAFIERWTNAPEPFHPF